MQRTITIEGGIEKKSGGVVVWSLWALLTGKRRYDTPVGSRHGRFRVTTAKRGRFKIEPPFRIRSMYVIRDTIGGDYGRACKSRLRKALAPLSVRVGARFNVKVVL